MNNFLVRLFKRLPYLIRLLLTVIAIILFFGTLIHLVEPGQFPTIFDGVWWAVITTSTIGYGDFVPLTFPGKIIGILLVITGVGFVTTYFVGLAAKVIKIQNGLIKGTLSVNVKYHIIIVGWNERSKELITNLHQSQPEKPILLIDSSLAESPIFKEKNVYFIKGNAYSDEILQKAHVKEAEIIIITSDAEKSEVEADMQTVLTIVAIKGYAPKSYCVAEILTNEQLINAKRAGADEIIPSNRFSSSIMFNTVMTHGVSNAFSNFANVLQGVKFDIIEGKSYGGYTFSAINEAFLQDQKILVGLIRSGKTIMAPAPDTTIDLSDKLLLISSAKNTKKYRN